MIYFINYSKRKNDIYNISMSPLKIDKKTIINLNAVIE